MAGFEHLTAQHVTAGIAKQPQQTQTQMKISNRRDGCDGE
jgi:hypothetical protein